MFEIYNYFFWILVQLPLPVQQILVKDVGANSAPLPGGHAYAYGNAFCAIKYLF